MKNRLFQYCLLTLLAFSCVKEQQEIIPTTADESVFYAMIETAGDPETRVYVDDKLRVLWNSNDRVSIFNKYTYNQEYRFSGEDGDNAGSFYKVQNDEFVTGNPLGFVFSVYPYQESTKIDNDGQITVILPATQSYRENSFGQEANTMISVTEDNQLLFKNLCGYLSVKLYGDNVTVGSISLKGNNNEPLSGKAFVTASVGNAPSMSFDASATSEITLSFDSPITLGATTETATSFWLVVPPTTFSKGITLTVKDKQNGVFEKSTTKSLAISRNMLSKMSPLEVSIAEPEPDGVVDLGLSVKWATCNLGASSPEEYGDYYAWGETEPYYSSQDPLIWKPGKENGYEWSSYKWCAGSEETLTKYCFNSSFGIVDNKTTLELEDDAAWASMGGMWRIPTQIEFQELCENCISEWTTENGINGRRFTSKKEGYTDRSVFFPAAGFYTLLDSRVPGGVYWSSSLKMNYLSSSYGNSFYCSAKNDPYNSGSSRSEGLTIRPVLIIPVTDIQLSESSLSLHMGGTHTLTATLVPDDASRKPVWASSNEAVALVDEQGTVRTLAEGVAIITAKANDGSGVSASCTVTVSPISIPEAVDLGLSVKWASFNLGASSPEEYGQYYAWGETVPKDKYTWETYKWCEGNYKRLLKYCSDSSYGSNGYCDFKTVLDLNDDAAHVALEGNWRIPTSEEWMELLHNCTRTWTTENNVNGQRYTSNINGNSIFLPAAGERHDSLSGAGGSGMYWSSWLQTSITYSAIFLGFHSGGLYHLTYYDRYYGFSIRPVCPKD